MSGVELVGRPPNIAAAIAAFTEEAHHTNLAALEIVQRRLADNTPKRTRRTADSITGAVRFIGDTLAGSFVGEVRFKRRREYIARFQDKGTSDHVVLPRASRRNAASRAAINIPGVGPRYSAVVRGVRALHFIERTRHELEGELVVHYQAGAARAAARAEKAL